VKVNRERSWEKNPGRFSGAVLRDDMLTAYLSGGSLTPAQDRGRSGRPHLLAAVGMRRAGRLRLGG